MPDLTPAEYAELDAHLDTLINPHRVAVAGLGPIDAAATLAAVLADRDPAYLAGLAAHAITRLAQQDPIRAVADAHPLTIDSRTADGTDRPRCGCGWTGDWTTSLQLARAEHAAHVHIVARIAQEQP